MAANGAVELRDNSAKVLAQIGDLTEQKLRDLAEEMTDIAKTSCPVDTGNLRDSIEWDAQEMNKDKKTVTVYTQTGYGAYVELGTARQGAQPFLAPAFKQAFNTVVENGGKMG